MALRTREASDYGKDWSEGVGDVLRRWVKRRGLLKAGPREKIFEAWVRMLGSDAAHTSLEGLSGNVATFAVDSSALLSELSNFRKQELLEGLRREVKTYFVRDIRFKLIKRGGAAGKGV